MVMNGRRERRARARGNCSACRLRVCVFDFLHLAFQTRSPARKTRCGMQRRTVLVVGLPWPAPRRRAVPGREQLRPELRGGG